MIRALPRLWVRHAYVSDTYYHLFCSQVIRDNSYQLPQRLPRVVLNHAYTYPFAYHYLLALFPYQARMWLERLTGAIFDTLSGLIIYCFLSWVIKQKQSISLSDLPLLVTALYTFSPALLRIPWGPRSYHGSPRVAGEMLYLLHITTAYFCLVSKSLPWLIVSLLSGALLMLTAKFGTQVLLFFGIFFSIFIFPFYSIMILGCFLIELMLSWGHGWRIITGHVRHSIYYFKHIQQVFIWPQLKTIRDYLCGLSESLEDAVKGGKWWRPIQWYCSERYFLHLLVTVYPQFLCFILWCRHWAGMTPFDQFLMVWMGAGLFWFFLTSLKWGLFIGEGDRYLEYALLPSLVLFTQYSMPGHRVLVYGFLTYSIGLAAYYMVVFLLAHGGDNDQFQASVAVLKELNQLPEGVIWPIGAFHYQALVRTTFPVLSHGGNMDERLFPPHEFMLVYGNYPYPSDRFSEIVRRYNVSYIMGDAISLKYYQDKIVREKDEVDRRLSILWETPGLVIAKVLP
jgi:hypothetical protein